MFQAASESADGQCTVQRQPFFISHGPCRGALCGHDFRVGMVVDCFFPYISPGGNTWKNKGNNPSDSFPGHESDDMKCFSGIDAAK